MATINLVQMLVPQSKMHIKGTYPMTPQYITIHNTANRASAKSEISYMIRNDNYTSYHFAVDDLGAVQGLPLDRNGWHCGDGDSGTGNRQSIGIEICYSLDAGHPQYTQSEENGAILTAMLLKQYGWGIDRVRKHQDWSGKYCPHRILDRPNGWQDFLNKVQGYLNELNSHQEQRNVYEITGSAHVQNYGWQDMRNGMLGTTGQSLRLEAFSLKVTKDGQPLTVSGSIHVQDIGDVDSELNLFGTVGLSKRIEAIKIVVDAPIEYRVHAQDVGWSQWQKIGTWIGTKGQSKRIEAIEFRVI